MYKKILIAVAPDHPERLAEELSAAKAMADDGAEIAVLAVIESIPLYVAAEVPAAVFEKAEADAKAHLESELANEPGVALHVVHGHAPTVILDRAKDMGTDVIIIRSHKPDMSDWFIGSTAGRIVRHAACAVHVMR